VAGKRRGRGKYEWKKSGKNLAVRKERLNLKKRGLKFQEKEEGENECFIEGREGGGGQKRKMGRRGSTLPRWRKTNMADEESRLLN